MIPIIGTHNTAICYTGELEPTAAAQIKAVCDQPAFADCKIRIMPDVHAGMGCTIGTTMTITDKVVPGMVGVDIGCGMETVRIAQTQIDLERLDTLIHRYIPCGRDVRRKEHPLNDQIDLTALRCAPYVDLSRARKSIGTLGGGNHFIEVDRNESGDLYIVVHSGSRHIGNEVAKYYQDEGRKAFWGGARHQVDETIAQLRAEGRYQEIQPTIDRLRKEREISLPKDLAYVEGRLFDDYIHDMKIIQHFAALNRKAMIDVILSGMDLTPVEQFTTIHNYIDTDHMILRKGAVAAYAGQKLLIPINMRDGSLICVGKGDPDWNCSAPHGAGRLMSRKEAFKRLSMEEYRKEMAGIYTTCVDRTTLDEAPMAYKGIDEIISHIGPTVDILERIIPIYNFKAAE
ncbi:MAG: RtcB family protein [Oscillospiraceae bacterium]|nr:RtcB family protein [Oscillospiraceae bacterium]